MTFLVARPQGKAQSTCKMLQEAKLVAYAAPLIKIVLNDNTKTLSTLASVFSKDKPGTIIITSTYSANWFCEQTDTIQSLPTNIVCIGKGTAAVLYKNNPNKHLYIAQPETSEGALALPILNKVSNTPIVLLKGEGGRNMMGPSLTERGALVSELNVYKRIKNNEFTLPCTFEPSQIKCIIVTSVELAQMAVTILEPLFSREKLINLHWIVASQRIKDYAVSQGISRTTISDGASDNAILASAQKFQSTGAVNV